MDLSQIRVTGIRLRGDLGMVPDIGSQNEILQNFTIGGTTIGDLRSTTDNVGYFTDAVGVGSTLDYPYIVDISNDVNKNIEVSFGISADIHSNTFTYLSNEHTNATNPGYGLGTNGTGNSWEVQIDFQYDVYAPSDPFTSQHLSPTFSFGLNQNQPTGDSIIGNVLSSSENRKL